jgi:beta-lactam-binding protein with PASTA domain
MTRVGALIALFAVLVAACGPGDEGQRATGEPGQSTAAPSAWTQVPSNATFGLDVALERLLAAGLRASIDYFPPIPGGLGLENYAVAVQAPRAPARVRPDSVVTIRLQQQLASPSVAIRADHPPTVVVPDLISLPYSEAMISLGEGLWPAIGYVESLRPENSEHGLDAWVVGAQDPAAGTELPYLSGDTAASTVRLSLVQRDSDADSGRWTEVPWLGRQSLANATRLLDGVELRTAVSNFASGTISLEQQQVVFNWPASGTRVRKGDVVWLYLEEPQRPEPAGCIEPAGPARYRRIPNVIGLTYPEASLKLKDLSVLYTRVPAVLTPEQSSDGLSAFVVRAQDPSTGRVRVFACETRPLIELALGALPR